MIFLYVDIHGCSLFKAILCMSAMAMSFAEVSRSKQLLCPNFLAFVVLSQELCVNPYFYDIFTRVP